VLLGASTLSSKKRKEVLSSTFDLSSTSGYPLVSSPCPARSCPAPSLLKVQRERRETTELGYPGRCQRQPPETHGPCFGSPVAKSLVCGPGPGSLWGDRASSPPRFNTYSRGSTHLGVARLAPGFFLSFDSLTVGTPVSNLKLGRWDSRFSK
jgi:hypothetical protein